MKTSGDTGHGISSIYGTTGGSPSHPDTAREMREIFGDNVLVKKQQQANNSNPPKDNLFPEVRRYFLHIFQMSNFLKGDYSSSN